MMTSGLSGRLGEKGWMESSPNRAPNAICWSIVMSWSRSTITSYCTIASCTALNWAVLSGWLRSIPSISAPMKPLIGRTLMVCRPISASALRDAVERAAGIVSSACLLRYFLARIGGEDHGKRPGKRVRSAARDRQSGEDQAQCQHLGLPDRWHRDGEDAAAQPHGARFDRLPATRAAQRQQDRSLVGNPGQEDPPAGHAGAGRFAGILRAGRRHHRRQ